ncbi:MAG: hypothetical protein IH631_03135 [Candidatus Thorarchaeota archaeon]|nr:hypothetical protein [Candidatus Thorarchaeota archaeon]
MIEYILALVVLAVAILIFSGVGKPRTGGPRRISKGQTMVYKSDSIDVVADSYHPGIRGSVGPFPIGKKEERKKTETHQPRR